MLPSTDFHRLCLHLFRRIVPEALLSVYVRPAGSYVMGWSCGGLHCTLERQRQRALSFLWVILIFLQACVLPRPRFPIRKLMLSLNVRLWFFRW